MKVMLAGGLAGAFSKTCTAPLGRMTILFQLGALKGHTSVLGATKHVVQNQVSLRPAPLQQSSLRTSILAQTTRAQHCLHLYGYMLRRARPLHCCLPLQGFLSLWRGHTATLLHRIPYSSVNFAVFEHAKVVLAPVLKSRNEGGSYATEVRPQSSAPAATSLFTAFTTPKNSAGCHKHTCQYTQGGGA